MRRRSKSASSPAIFEPDRRQMPRVLRSSRGLLEDDGGDHRVGGRECYSSPSSRSPKTLASSREMDDDEALGSGDVIEVRASNREMADDETLGAGDVIEVRTNEEGFFGAWFEASVDRARPDRGGYDVVYDAIIADDDASQPLRELVLASDVRPRPPSTPAAQRYELHQLVEAFHDDGWWPGVISAVCGRGRYAVSFPTIREDTEFRPPQLRPRLEWAHGEWIVPDNLKVGAKRAKFKAKAAVEISGDKENYGFAWYQGFILKAITNTIFLVEYKYLKDNVDIEISSEIVDQQYIRPITPKNSEAKQFELLSKVEAFYHCGWFAGVVTKILEESMYVVKLNFRKEGEMEFQFSDLRLSCDLIRGSRDDVSSTATCDGRSVSEPRDGSIAIYEARSGTISKRKKEKRKVCACEVKASKPSKKRKSGDLLDGACMELDPKTSNALKEAQPTLPNSESPLDELNAASQQPSFGNYLGSSSCDNNETKKESTAPHRNREVDHVVDEAEQANETPKINRGQPPKHGIILALVSVESNVRNMETIENQVDTHVDTPAVHHSMAESKPVEILTDPQVSNVVSIPHIGNTINNRGFEAGNLAPLTPSAEMEADDVSFLPLLKDGTIVTNTGLASNGSSSQKNSVEVEVLIDPPTLPFTKRSSFWDSIEAMDIFRAMPQQPHFRQLEEYHMGIREGMAIGLMISFATLVGDLRKITIFDAEADFDGKVRTLESLEANGFDVHHILSRMKELLQMQNDISTLQTLILEEEKENGYLLDMTVRHDKEIMELEQKLARCYQERASFVKKSTEKELNIHGLQEDIIALEDGYHSSMKLFNDYVASS